jgi:hypothetical protein
MDEGVPRYSLQVLALSGRRCLYRDAAQYTYEITKAHVWQHRTLCEPCWRDSNRIAKELVQYDEQWVAAKARLRSDVAFLEAWLDLHTQARRYSAKEDVAKRRMIEKLLGR